MKFLSLAKMASGLAVSATMLAACVVVDEEPGYRPPPPRPDRPSICTREYAPVCGRQGRDMRTFGNACEARAADYRIVSQGECRGGGGGGSGWSRPDRPPPQRACTREYAPVCARQGRDVRTFGNACEAEVADYRITHPGPCRAG